MAHFAKGIHAERARTGMARLACIVVCVAAAFPAVGWGELSASARVRPLSLAADDFDGDGMRDLACGYATGSGGLVTIARGDVDAVYGPGSLSADSAPPFFAAEPVAVLGVTPDLLAAGDFDNDGHRDLVVGAIGQEALYVLAGDGRGALSAPRPISLPGRLTALASGDVNRIDGLADLVVAIDGAAGPRVLVIEGPDGAITAEPEVIAAPSPVSALAIGQFDEGGPIDIAAAAGSFFLVVHGRDRKLVAGEQGAHTAPAPTVDVRAAGAPVRALDLEALAKGSQRADSPLNDATVVASVAMRLNADAIEDYVVIRTGETGPSFVVSRLVSTFTVTTTADDGAGSLRVAINQANAVAGADRIVFNIAGGGVHTIQPLSPLPVITDPVTIDATTQPGFSGTPLVEIDGSLAGAAAIGLQVDAGSTLIRGLVVNRFGGQIPDGGIGIYMQNGGGNVVEGNYLGVDATGAEDRANEDIDVYIYESANNVIGGTVPAARNVIAGSCRAACVTLTFSDIASGNRVQGNYIGTDATGTVDLNAASNGILFDGGMNNIIGGTDPGSRNVIAGNGGDFAGAEIFLQGVHNNLVQGNYIGTDASGTVGVSTSPSTSVIVDGGAQDNTIGGTATGAANRIGFNIEGIQVGEFNGISNGNAILSNAISGHDALGLGLGYDDVTPNDAGDTDQGPNNLQNFPVLTSASRNDDMVTVTGRLNSTPNTAFRIEIFATSMCNRFGFGEGETFLGARNATTDASGNVEFSATVSSDAAQGSSITVTATDPGGNTSEFSMCVELELTWQPPDQNATVDMPPPQNLAVRVLSTGQPSALGAPRFWRQGNGEITGYRVYRSNQPGVQPSPATFFTSVPPTQTMANSAVFVGGTFFVVTAVYPNGESGPSNEVVTGTPPTIASVKATAAKVTAKGSGFTTDSVLVTADGIPFLSAAVVKNGGKKVIQRGPLITGESIVNYARTRPGGVVTILIRNSNGGIEGRRITVRGS